MKAYTCFLRVLTWVVTFLLGIYLFVGFLTPNLFRGGADWLKAFPGSLLACAGGLALVGLCAIFMIWRIRGVIRAEHIEFETTRGKILVTLSALQESIERSLAEDENIRASHVTILNAGTPSKPLRVHAQVEIFERNDVVGLQKHLQGVLEERFKEMMTVDRDVRYDVELIRIRTKARRKDQKDEGGDEALFQGPQYPVDDQ